VLWLLETNCSARNNLCDEAAVRGVDPARLIFAPIVAPSQHLARFKLVDLVLDTLPYNLHTTACDALWIGTPLVTCRGQSFAGRVASSLLNADGVPELATDNLKDYEELALRLAGDPEGLKSLRLKLEDNRAAQPLFDTDRFRRNIEMLYMQMVAHSRHLAGGSAPGEKV
jgi:predicted O-linked N-acetylglucosamine transferase (SPINDLY family)